MTRPLLRLNLTAVGILLALAGLAACSASPTSGSAAPSAPDLGGPSPAGTVAPIAVLGTENFYADLLAEIGGARVTATSLLNDPNADPHAFESNAQAAVAVADARLAIPIKPGLHSLNIAMAAAMALGEALRQTGSTIGSQG